MDATAGQGPLNVAASPGAQDTRKGPLDVTDGWLAAWNSHDADALTALFVEDADFINVVGMWFRGHGQIRFNHAYGFAHMFGASSMRFAKTKVRELGPDAAIIVAAWELTGQVDPDGTPSGPRTGVLTFVVTRTEAGWRAVSAQNTDRIPDAQTHVASPGGLTPTHYERPRESERPTP